jgi:quercetin dioxygenase-like cupin family protein
MTVAVIYDNAVSGTQRYAPAGPRAITRIEAIGIFMLWDHAGGLRRPPPPLVDRCALSREIDAMKAVRTVQINTPRVIVTEWAFAPGAETGQHVHGMDYVVVPMTSGALRLIEPEGTRDAHLTAGISYCRPAGVNHNVINVNDFEFRFLEIELK